MTEFPIHKKNYSQWRRHASIVCRYDSTRLEPPPSIQEIQALIERGIQLKKEGKTRDYDEWAHSMRMLKRKLKEIEKTS